MDNRPGVDDVVAKLVRGGDGCLAHLSDSELLANTRGLVGKSNQLFAALLAHLAEVQARGLHRTRACASLYTYCIYELRFSEDAAARRAGAAKLVKRFPLLLGAIANGELHLTGLLMLGPHLTPENIIDVLGRAKFRTKKELAKLLRELRPLPLVPDVIEPLCPDRAPLHRPTWQEFVSSFAPAVRELPPGERPCDWAGDEADANRQGGAHGASEHDANKCDADSASFSPAPARVEPLGAELPPVTGPQQYQLQFSTTEEHVQLIERAKSLLARAAPGKSLGELHLQAMKLLVAALEKQKFAVSERPRKRRHQADAEPQEAPLPARARPTAPHQPGRHIPAVVRREVFQRDSGSCTYVDERGERCRETRSLELHHRQPFGKNGTHAASNLTLHCPAHNALAAELDFGRQHMAGRRDPHRHESRASEERAAGLREPG
jgi:5-methylcytosine-specific restriction endonuclease McrA